MKEKDLKLKQKRGSIKTKGEKTAKPVKMKSALQQKMKADYIRTKARKPSEKETNEAVNRSEEVFTEGTCEAAVYGANCLTAEKGQIRKEKPTDRQKAESYSERFEVDTEREKSVLSDVFQGRQEEKFRWKQETNQGDLSSQQRERGIFRKRFAVKKSRKRKEKRRRTQETNFLYEQRKKAIVSGEGQEKREMLYRSNGNEPKSISVRGNEKNGIQLERKEDNFQQYQKEAKKQSFGLLRRELFSQKSQPTVQKSRKRGWRENFAKAVTNTGIALFKSVLAALGGLSGIVVVFAIIGAVLALVSTAFGVFFSPFDDTAGTRKISEIVAETNRDFYEKVSKIEADVKHDSIEYHAVSGGGEQLFITNWPEVVAVFAARTSGEKDGASDVVTIDDTRAALLREVFWDMNRLSYRTKKVNSDTGNTKTVLQITLTSRGYREMMEEYQFTPYQKQMLEELMQPEYAQMLSELVGTLGTAGGSIALTPMQAQEMLQNLPADLSPERRRVMEKAYSLVGKVNYFWGGKSEVIGWDSRWGTPQKVTAAGSNTTGMTLPFGLDCSGFVTWVFINATGDPAYANVIGHGARNQYGKCRKISWGEAQPGDLVFYPDLGHVGIVAGKDEKGELLVVHCASSQNCVVVTGRGGFTKIGRPRLYE